MKIKSTLVSLALEKLVLSMGLLILVELPQQIWWFLNSMRMITIKKKFIKPKFKGCLESRL